ncbi:MAG: CotH kinase family protein [Verrucomicrobia bacterium]|nr:CotH kinase family protein [Verrucomicrobiota bacterium]
MNIRLLSCVSLLGLIPPGNGAWAASPGGALFDTGRLLEVRVEIAPADWDALRKEHHDLLAALGPARFDRPEPKPYKTYRADVVLDGTRFEGVGLRKRGFLGSSSMQRPSLGLRLGSFGPGRAFRGATRLSLNNNLQDPSQLHQVLAYAVFAKAGVPAPRCSLAHVTVNGTSLGIYSHVEPVRAPLLERHFGSAAGQLYEGQLSDFRPDWVKTFEAKTSAASDRRNLEAVVAALQADDADLPTRLAPRVDIAAYLRFWAVEALLGLWDSYSNNGNNFFIYAPPHARPFAFIPWGADAAFGDRDPFAPVKTPESVKARSLLPHRLYALPSIRERYRARLRETLETAWREPELLAEVDRLQALVEDNIHVAPHHFQNALSELRRFIRTRRAQLAPELEGPFPEWPLPPRAAGCLRKTGRLAANFSVPRRAAWPPHPLNHGSVNLVWKTGASDQTFAAAGAVSVPAADARHFGFPTLGVLAMPKGTTRIRGVALVIQPEFYRNGAHLPVDGFSVGGVVLEGGLLRRDLRVAGIPLGTLHLLDAGQEPGDPVTGRLEADLYRLPE